MTLGITTKIIMKVDIMTLVIMTLVITTIVKTIPFIMTLA